MTTLLHFLAVNALWLFALGFVLWLAGRKWHKRAAFWHLLWIVLLVKTLLPPIASVELGVWREESVELSEIQEPEVQRSETSGHVELPQTTAQNTIPHVAFDAIVESNAFDAEVESDAFDMMVIENDVFDAEVESNAFNAIVEGNANRPDVALRSTSGSLTTDNGELVSEFNSTLPTPNSKLIITLLWCVGALVILAVSLRRIVRFRRCLGGTEPADAETQRLADDVAARLGLARPVDVRVVEACLPPMVWAFFSKPVVLFPKSLLAKLEPEQRSLLLAHELAHVKRRDHWVRYLELICTAFYWWHPMLWLARRELREAEELCCDAWATWLFPGQNRDYGRALLATIDYLSETETAVPVPIVGSGMSMRETQRRIEMIMKSNNPRTLSLPLRGLLILLALLILPFSATLTARQSDAEKPQNVTILETQNDTVDEQPQYVDETFTLNVRLFASPGSGGLPNWATVELWDYNLVTGEGTMVESTQINDGPAVFENIVRPIDARWFDQKTRRKFDKPVEVEELHEYRVFAKVNGHAWASLREKIEVLPSYYPKTAEEIDANFQTDLTHHLAMYDVGNVAGLVVSPDGMPIAGAKIQVAVHVTKNEKVQFVSVGISETDQQGRFKIENAPKSIRLYFQVQADHYQTVSDITMFTETMKITLEPEEQAAPDSVPLPPIAPKATDVSKIIDLPEGEAFDVVPATAAFQVIDDATDKPLPGVTLTVHATDANYRILGNMQVAYMGPADKNREFTFVTDENGLVSFEYPQKLTDNNDKTERVREYEIHVNPLEKDGKHWLAGWNNHYLSFHSNQTPQESPTVIPMKQGHLLIGRVVDAETRNPLSKTDDGNPIRIGFMGKSLADGLPDASPSHTIVEVDENGMFQCYRPAGVNWPYILPNGQDILWTRTEDYQRWQNEGVLVKPGNITTLEFRVTSRLDKNSPVWQLPVAEEVPVATKLIATPNSSFGINDHGHINVIFYHFGAKAQHFDLETARKIGQLPELKHLAYVAHRVDGPYAGSLSPMLTADMFEGFSALEYLSLNGFLFSPEVIEKISEMTQLNGLAIAFEGDDPSALAPLLKLEKLEWLCLNAPQGGQTMMSDNAFIRAWLRGDTEEMERLNKENNPDNPQPHRSMPNYGHDVMGF